MLTRLYVDNFRCFVNFEYRPARRQLILGANGSGKSSLIEALLFLHRFAVRGESLYDEPLLDQRTRWLNQPNMTFELSATLDGGNYAYRLEVAPAFERPAVLSETVQLDGRPIFEFTRGEVYLYNDSLERKLNYQIDWHRSALATVPQGSDIQKLTRFRHWLRGVVCFRLNPFAMAALAEAAEPNPAADLSNAAAWYRHLQPFPLPNSALLTSLRGALEGFVGLMLWPAARADVLGAEFRDAGGRVLSFRFNELSEGQRCLICLYLILHFVLAQGNTVIIDEPDNFISLREIQPWLMAVTDAVEQSNGQILLISHHPELINQWAPDCGVQFVREGIGPVRAERFHGEPDSALSPAELVARGWENG